MARSTVSTDSMLQWHDQMHIFDEMVLSWISFGQQQLDTTHYNSVLTHPIFTQKLYYDVNNWEESQNTQKFVDRLIIGRHEPIFPRPPAQTRKILTAKSSYRSKRKIHNPHIPSLPTFTKNVDKEWIPEDSDLSDNEPDYEPEQEDQENAEVESWELKNPGYKYGGDRWTADDLTAALRQTAKPTSNDLRLPFLQTASAYKNRHKTGTKTPTSSTPQAPASNNTHADDFQWETTSDTIHSTPAGNPMRPSTAKRLYEGEATINKRKRSRCDSKETETKQHLNSGEIAENELCEDFDCMFKSSTPNSKASGLIRKPSSVCFDGLDSTLSTRGADKLTNTSESETLDTSDCMPSSYMSDGDTPADLPDLSDSPADDHALTCPWSHSSALSTTAVKVGGALTWCPTCKAPKVEPTVPAIVDALPDTPNSSSLSLSKLCAVETAPDDITSRQDPISPQHISYRKEKTTPLYISRRKEKITPKYSYSESSKENIAKTEPVSAPVASKPEYKPLPTPLGESTLKSKVGIDLKSNIIDLTMLPVQCKVQKRITDFFKR